MRVYNCDYSVAALGARANVMRTESKVWLMTQNLCPVHRDTYLSLALLIFAAGEMP